MSRGAYAVTYIAAFLILLAPVLYPYLNVSAQLESGERVALATTTIIWDFARNVAGPGWRVEYLVEPGKDPHTLEPTPRDLQKAADAELILYNGFGVDSWILRLVAASSKAKIVRVTEGLEGHALIVPDGPYAGKTDPHMWMDASLAVKYVERIRDAFIELDPSGAAGYKERAERYIERLMALDAWIREEVSKIEPSRRLLFTQENALQYFARAYGFRVVGYFYSMVTELEPSPLDVARAQRRVEGTGLCVFFIESTLSPRVMEAFASRLNGRIAGRLYTDSLGPAELGLDSYIGIMKYNVETIVRELSRWC
ncbi:MAG: zinc ABC transporter substrate-binding protein [Nitrososphaerota archaeon]|nr:zinc ABC transporter substrate-binding protein [Candidatus Calditenuaceae archaeon]MDW8073412.1 zinc ABC transporter substrate-binding protein [Nitrososphaerota archaeon]